MTWIIYRNGPATALDRSRKLTSGVLGQVDASSMLDAETAGRLSWGGKVFAVKARGATPAEVKVNASIDKNILDMFSVK